MLVPMLLYPRLLASSGAPTTVTRAGPVRGGTSFVSPLGTAQSAVKRRNAERMAGKVSKDVERLARLVSSVQQQVRSERLRALPLPLQLLET